MGILSLTFGLCLSYIGERDFKEASMILGVKPEMQVDIQDQITNKELLEYINSSFQKQSLEATKFHALTIMGVGITLILGGAGMLFTSLRINA